jgi:hypothetical protein
LIGQIHPVNLKAINRGIQKLKAIKSSHPPPMHHRQQQCPLAIVWLRGKNRSGESLITGTVDSSTKMMMELSLTEKRWNVNVGIIEVL